MEDGKIPKELKARFIAFTYQFIQERLVKTMRIDTTKACFALYTFSEAITAFHATLQPTTIH